jgi:hypothetical protein
VSTGGAAIYRYFFQFEAMDWGNWAAVHHQYLNGATIPFDFVVTTLGMAMLAVTGCLLLAFRAARLHDLLFEMCLLVSPPVVLPVQFRFAPMLSLSRALVTFIRLFRHPWRSFIWRSRKPKLPAFAEPCRDVLVPDSEVEATAAAVETVPEVIAPAIDVEERRTPSPVDDATPPSAVEIDADYAVFGRAMALFEVWTDPAPDWMCAALREELEKLSEAGWSLFTDFGDPAMFLLDKAETAGLLPADAAKREAIRTVLEIWRKKDDSPELSMEDPAQPSPRAIDGEDETSVPPGGPHLTMSAAWLCELVDNYVMLEDIRAAGCDAEFQSFDERWGGIYQETGERLQRAMQTMTDQDWRSIDQFPDRAGRIRVLTDRFREALRTNPGGAPGSSEESSPAVPPVDAGSPIPRLEPSLEDILRGAGYVVKALPAMPGSAAKNDVDYLARRDGISVLLRLAELGGGDWSMDGDSLAPWRGGTGDALPSPCRLAWQRLALLRSLNRDEPPCAAVVVLRDGRFTDEQAVAHIIERDCRRTDVGLVWLDRSQATLPDLAAWLVRMEVSAS